MAKSRRPYRKTEITERQKAICDRLVDIRRLMGMTQKNFAILLFVSEGVVLNCEYHKAPVRCDVALKACCTFVFSERWLATGEGHRRLCAGLAADPVFLRLEYDAPFDIVFDNELRIPYAAVTSEGVRSVVSRLFNQQTGIGGREEYIFNAVLDILRQRKSAQTRVLERQDVFVQLTERLLGLAAERGIDVDALSGVDKNAVHKVVEEGLSRQHG